MTNIVLENVWVVDPAAGHDEKTGFIVREGVVQPPGTDTAGLPRKNAEGCLVAPGFWDAHVHFRDPGNPAAGTRFRWLVATGEARDDGQRRIIENSLRYFISECL